MRNLKYTAFTILSVLAICELACRFEGFGHPLLYRAARSGYEIVPDQHVVRLGKSMLINARGTRGAMIAPSASPGVWRIMVLGDSVANGGGQLDDAQTFPAVASRLLDQKKCRNEIVNASAGGWSLFDEMAWINQHGLGNATTLVWTVNAMDLDQAPSTAAILDRNPSFPSHLPATALGEILFRYVIPRLGLGVSAADNGSLVGPQFDQKQFAAVSSLITSAKRQMDQKGVRMIVLFHDTLSPVSVERQRAETQFLDKLRGLGVVVSQTGLSREKHPGEFYVDAIHPNARGDLAIGSRLAALLANQCPARSQRL